METNDLTNQIWRSAWQSVVCEYQFSFLLGRGEKKHCLQCRRFPIVLCELLVRVTEV